MTGRRLPDTPIDRIPGEVQAGDYWRVTVKDDDGERPMNVVEPAGRVDVTDGGTVIALRCRS